MQRTEVLEIRGCRKGVCKVCGCTHLGKTYEEAGNVGRVFLPEDGRGRCRGKERVRLLLWSS